MTNTDYCETCLKDIQVPLWFNKWKSKAFCSPLCRELDKMVENNYGENPYDSRFVMNQKG